MGFLRDTKVEAIGYGSDTRSVELSRGNGAARFVAEARPMQSSWQHDMPPEDAP
jgi:hypothetical protein